MVLEYTFYCDEVYNGDGELSDGTVTLEIFGSLREPTITVVKVQLFDEDGVVMEEYESSKGYLEHLIDADTLEYLEDKCIDRYCNDYFEQRQITEMEYKYPDARI